MSLIALFVFAEACSFSENEMGELQRVFELL
jgi:hypothetical protein